MLLTQNLDALQATNRQGRNRSAARQLQPENLVRERPCSDERVGGQDDWPVLGAQRQHQRLPRSRRCGRGGASGGVSEQLRYRVEPSEFVGLRKGGVENDCQVEAIAFRSGRPFRASGANHLRVFFSQNISGAPTRPNPEVSSCPNPSNWTATSIRSSRGRMVFLPQSVRGFLVLLKIMVEEFLHWATRPVEVFFRYKFGTQRPFRLPDGANQPHGPRICCRWSPSIRCW